MTNSARVGSTETSEAPTSAPITVAISSSIPTRRLVNPSFT